MTITLQLDPLVKMAARLRDETRLRVLRDGVMSWASYSKGSCLLTLTSAFMYTVHVGWFHHIF